MKKIIEKIKEFFISLPASKYLLFILGMFLCAAVGIVIPKFAEWPGFVLPFLYAFINVFVAPFKKSAWLNCLAFTLGALAIQILYWIA